MRILHSVILALSLCGVLQSSVAATITREWTSKDRSNATVTVKGGESIVLPKKGGGTISVPCGGVECTQTLADFKDKEGNITYSSKVDALQTINGTIDKGVGTFAITTTGQWDGLFNNVVVQGVLTNSTGFTAQIGLPGDQLPQGGNISYSTKWFSDSAIGLDPITGDQIILGDFFLDSALPLTSFSYRVLNPDAFTLSASFTIGEVYRFSTGLNITGTVTKDMVISVPEPSEWAMMLVGFALVGYQVKSRRRAQ